MPNTTSSNSGDPLVATAVLATGEPLVMRPLRPDDGDRLADYFDALSDATRDRYGPHPFDRATAQVLCAATAAADVLRLVGTVPAGGGAGGERIIAYFLLKRGVHQKDAERYAARGMPLDGASDVTLAPSVADAYQDKGVGSRMMAHALAVARGPLGRRRVVLWGGVQAANDRAVHFYRKFGFQEVGEFYTQANDRDNFDMILELAPE